MEIKEFRGTSSRGCSGNRNTDVRRVVVETRFGSLVGVAEWNRVVLETEVLLEGKVEVENGTLVETRSDKVRREGRREDESRSDQDSVRRGEFASVVVMVLVSCVEVSSSVVFKLQLIGGE